MTASAKLYYKIGEIADNLKINTSVLRFWETQFESLTPRKTKSGQRIYSHDDFELIKEIYNLLYIQKLTIAGARSRLSLARKGRRGAEAEPAEVIQAVCHELKELRKLID